MNAAKFKIRLIDFLVTGFGVGYIPKAPGTFGTLLAIPMFVAMVRWLTPEQILVGITVFIFFAIYICHIHEAQSGEHDLQRVVIDEVAGYFVAALFLPDEVWVYAAAFVLFRFFDILKPYPIRLLDQRVKGGLGIVIDDLAAGLVTNIILQAVVRWA